MNELKLVPSASKPLITLPSLSGLISREFSTNEKLAFAGACVGIGSVTLVIYYFRRKRVKHRKGVLRGEDARGNRRYKPLTIVSPGGENSFTTGAVSPGFHRTVPRQSSVCCASDRCSSVASSTVGLTVGPDTTPQQFGVLGMEALGTALTMFEDALASYSKASGGGMALTTQEESEFVQSLQRVIDDSYSLQDQCEHLFLHQHSVIFRGECAENASLSGTIDSKRMTSASSVDSFVSAQGDIADLRDLEDFDESLYPLYVRATKLHEEEGIPYRVVRTEQVGCVIDAEYISKVHCIRLASYFLFSQPEVKEWFIDAGRQIITHLMIRANKDPKDVLIGYDNLIHFVEHADWEKMDEEFKGRGVVALTFYDIVLDFILLDAFEDLEKPPSSVIAVVQNRWLSDNFKESALSTAVWSVLKAKRRLLTHPDGFISHFYDVTEYLSPVLAWGFLGPDEELRDVCNFFKDQIMSLLRDMFSFTMARYTSVEELSSDILDMTKNRFGIILNNLTENMPQNGFG